MNCYKALTKDPRAVAAGGGAEIALARRLRDHGSRQPGLQQYSICAYADALEAIPRTLAENSGLDAEVRPATPADLRCGCLLCRCAWMCRPSCAVCRGIAVQLWLCDWDPCHCVAQGGAVVHGRLLTSW